MKFEHIDAPYSFKEYWSKYPEGYTIYEAILDWVKQTNEMTDFLNITSDKLDAFYVEVDATLKTYAEEQLQAWLDDGTLEGIISEAILLKADKSYVDEVKEDLDEVILDVAANTSAIAENYITIPLLVSDGVSDQSSLISSFLETLTAPERVIIPPNTVWDYRTITHPDNIQILDFSTYDWVNSDFGAMQKIILKTDDPGTKNANEFQIVSPYHPAVVIDVLAEGQRASVVFREEGSGKWQLLSDWYNDDSIFTIKDLRRTGFQPVFQVAGGDDTANEIAFNNVVVPGAAYVFKSRVDGNNIVRFVSASTTYATMVQVFADTLETMRMTFGVDGTISLSDRVNGKTLQTYTDGVFKQYYRTNAGNPNSAVTPRFIGEEVLDTTTNQFWKCTALSAAGWKQITT